MRGMLCTVTSSITMLVGSALRSWVLPCWNKGIWRLLSAKAASSDTPSGDSAEDGEDALNPAPAPAEGLSGDTALAGTVGAGVAATFAALGAPAPAPVAAAVSIGRTICAGRANAPGALICCITA